MEKKDFCFVLLFILNEMGNEQAIAIIGVGLRNKIGSKSTWTSRGEWPKMIANWGNIYLALAFDVGPRPSQLPKPHLFIFPILYKILSKNKLISNTIP